MNNKKELTCGLNNFLEDEELRKKISHLGYKRSKSFSWNKTAKKTLEVYKWVLESKKSLTVRK